VGETDGNGYPIKNYDNEHIEFRDDIVYYKGTPFNGRLIKYFENGKIEYEKHYRNEGIIDNEVLRNEEGFRMSHIFYDNGKFKSNIIYRDGEEVERNYSKEMDSLMTLYNLNGFSSGKSENGDCFTRDNNFIQNKMKQLNRDIVSIQNTGNRNYFVQYVDWRTGTGQQGSVVLDYSNSPCN
tara:strand:- start:10 stop:552 length:543 start_codon:yes stop_codon:yes gene_type:complete